MKKKRSLLEIIHLLSKLIVFDNMEFDQFLKRLIKLVVKIIPVDSCLVYLYDKENKRAVLIGSKKSHTDLLGRIALKKGEGITGWVAEHKTSAVLPKKAYEDERFKFFSELPEDRYEAFLSVPIVNKGGVAGVLNLQNKKEYTFSAEEVRTVEAVVAMIASAFEKIALSRRLKNLSNKLDERKVIEKAKGILMREKRLSEEEAYRLLRTESMRKRKTVRNIADAVLLVYH